jgi:hypothetical protein
LQVVRSPESLDLPQELVSAAGCQAELLTPAATLTALREFVDARVALRDQVPGIPQLPIELAFLRAALASGPQAAVAAVAARPLARPASLTPATAPAPSVGLSPEPVASHLSPVAAAYLSEARRSDDAGQKGTPPPAEAVSDTELLGAAQAAWDKFLTLAGKRCGMKVQAALRSVREVDTSGQTIVLQFSHAFARDLVNQTENRTRVTDLWSELLGRSVQVRCRLPGESLAPAALPPAGQTMTKPQDDEETFLQGARELGAVVRRLE